MALHSGAVVNLFFTCGPASPDEVAVCGSTDPIAGRLIFWILPTGDPMKKNTIHLLTVAALSMFLVACGDKQSTTSAPAAPTPMASTPAPDPVQVPPVAMAEPATDTVAPGAATTTSDAPAASTAATPMGTTSAAGGAVTVADGAIGKGVYDKACALCHAAGVAGAPKLADKADWTPRIAQGKDTLYKHAIEG